MSDNRHQLDRIENKIDSLSEKIDAQSNRVTALETQGGMIKWGMTFLIPIVGWIVAHLSKH